MMIDDDRQTHEDGVAELHERYHRYKLGFRGYRRQPLDYVEWLEHTTVRLAEKLGGMEEERDRYRHAADANHECWQETTRINNNLYGLLAAVRASAMRGDLKEVCRLLMVWACWN